MTINGAKCLKANFLHLVVFAQILSGVILEVLGEAFAEVVTPEVAAAWTKLLANMCCSVSAVYKEVGWTAE